MKLIQKINADTTGKTRADLKEDAAGGAVGGGDVAAAAMPLFAQLVKRSMPKIKVIKPPKKKKSGLGLAEAYQSLTELDPMGGSQSMGGMDMGGQPSGDTGDGQKGTGSFDNSSVISKLKGLEKKDEQDRRNTVTFGLEDDDGGIVRVTVKSEQGEEFEKALQSFIADADHEGENPEIAEILFTLKDQFDIVDVEWPEVQEDEEQDVDMQGLEGDQPADGQPDLGDGNADIDAGAPPADDGQIKDLLTQVIDMMKADAEARKAEARAKEAEAKVKEADAIVQQAMTKVKQEEQFLDMDSYNKARKEEEREAKRLAQLARWKHDMKKDHDISDDEDFDSAGSELDKMMPPQNVGQENEERANRPAKTVAQPSSKTPKIKGRVHPHDIASFILSRVK